ncbi:MAG: Rne/Rng family ribonuclease, partial [Planctomycetota bacterium]
MSQKMLINASEPEEIRVAIVEGSILEEFYVERMSVQSALGNIYKGRVTNVEPSIGAAFVEIGGSRHGFLHVSDVMDETQVDLDAEPVELPEPADFVEPDESLEPDEPPELDETAEPEAAFVPTEPPPLAVSPDPGDAPDFPEPEEDWDRSPSVSPDLDELAGPESGLDKEADPEVGLDGFPEAEPADPDAGDGPAGDPLRGEMTDEPDDPDDSDESGDLEAARARGASKVRSSGGRPDKAAPRLAGASAARETGAGKTPKKNMKSRQIQDLLRKGQEVIVQVTKDGIGTKGPTLTTYISLPGRYLVLMPGLNRKGVSRKIEDGRERDRLKKVLAQLDVREGLGFIVRTAGVGHTKAALQKDYRYLTKLWDEVETSASSGAAPKELYRESDLVIRTIRDVYGPEMGDIIIDKDDVARRAREFLATVMPKAVQRVKLYNGERPLFNAYGIEEEIGRLFMHRVELPSGGSLVVEQTEALVAIDVNSGRFRDEDDLEETAYKINLEAAAAIARQLRLRDLGGVIVVDFIDMRSEKRRRGVERAFKNALKDDRARIKVARISPFGVIEMTRQRVRPSLRQSIFQRCPTCRGAGYVATTETLELNLVRQIKLMLARRNAGIDVYLNQENAEYLMNEKRSALLALEEDHGKPVVLRLEPELRGDEFRIVPRDQKQPG